MTVADTLRNAIKQVEEKTQKDAHNQKVQKNEYKKMLSLLNQKNPKKQEGLNLICYKSLAYCCGLSKPCLHRDTALAILEISKDKFKEIKNKMHKEFMEVKSNGKSII